MSPMSTEFADFSLVFNVGPHRMRKKMYRNYMFYLHYPYDAKVAKLVRKVSGADRQIDMQIQILLSCPHTFLINVVREGEVSSWVIMSLTVESRYDDL